MNCGPECGSLAAVSKIVGIDPGYKAEVEAAMSALETALAEEDPATKTGDPARLKAAHAALDEATRPLADLLMDKAMDARLRQRGLP